MVQQPVQIFEADVGLLRLVLRPMIPARRACRRCAPVLLLLVVAGCAGGKPAWEDRNKRVIDEHKITGRTRELPPLTVPMVLADGEPVERGKLPTITIAPGVTASVGWGRGALVERVDMQAGASYPS